MNNQDREVVKALLQKLTESNLVDSDEFKAAIKHFNITTTCRHVQALGFDDGVEILVDVISPDTIDEHPYGVRYEFPDCDAAEFFSKQQRAKKKVILVVKGPNVSIEALNAQIARNNKLLVNLNTESQLSIQLANVNIVLREMVRRLGGWASNYNVMA